MHALASTTSSSSRSTRRLRAALPRAARRQCEATRVSFKACTACRPRTARRPRLCNRSMWNAERAACASRARVIATATLRRRRSWRTKRARPVLCMEEMLQVIFSTRRCSRKWKRSSDMNTLVLPDFHARFFHVRLCSSSMLPTAVSMKRSQNALSADAGSHTPVRILKNSAKRSKRMRTGRPFLRTSMYSRMPELLSWLKTRIESKTPGCSAWLGLTQRT
mmetsp:Transcript_7646/g.18883  ORF Transcript_7646/g.18883 Transcript_7646/m.18883 type:complete len:221 (+) Transcript_7646:2572-3234(+)